MIRAKKEAPRTKKFLFLGKDLMTFQTEKIKIINPITPVVAKTKRRLESLPEHACEEKS
jgi:hypothetical protein